MLHTSQFYEISATLIEALNKRMNGEVDLSQYLRESFTIQTSEEITTRHLNFLTSLPMAPY